MKDLIKKINDLLACSKNHLDWRNWVQAFPKLQQAKATEIVTKIKQFLLKSSKSTEREIDFVNDIDAAIVEQPRDYIHWGLYLTVFFILVAIVWAHFAVLDEITAGEGKVIPSSRIQVIQNLEGGILANLLVTEGQLVNKDQVLLYIDDTKFESSYREGHSRYLALLAAANRLEAEAQGKPLEFVEEVTEKAPQIVVQETQLFESRKRALEESLASLRRSYELALKELQMTEPLIKKGAVSEVELLRLRRQVNDLKGQIEDRRNQFRADAQLELNRNRADIAGLIQNNVANQDRVTRATVRSPVRGIVKRIYVSTIGGVIQPGMDILEVVPVEDELLIEAKIRPTDIAFLHPGQIATVKISAYDFAIYGGLQAQLEHISADTITDEKTNESYYQIYVRTDKNYLGSIEKPLPIIPGMTATVEIITGKKSVLQYLLKPLLKAKEKALRER